MAKIVSFCFSFWIKKTEIPEITNFIEDFISSYESYFNRVEHRHMVTVALHELVHIPLLTVVYGPMIIFSGFSIERIMSDVKRSNNSRKNVSKSLSKKEIGLFNIMRVIQLINNTGFTGMLQRRVIEESTKVLQLNHYVNLDVNVSKSVLELLNNDEELTRVRTKALKNINAIDELLDDHRNCLSGKEVSIRLEDLEIPDELKLELTGAIAKMSGQRINENYPNFEEKDIQIKSYTNLHIKSIKIHHKDKFEVATKTPLKDRSHFNIRKSLHQGPAQNKSSIVLLTSYGLKNASGEDGLEVPRKIRGNKCEIRLGSENSLAINIGAGYIKELYKVQYQDVKLELALVLVFEDLEPNNFHYKLGSSEMVTIQTGFKCSEYNNGHYRWVPISHIKSVCHQMIIDETVNFFLKENQFNFNRFIELCIESDNNETSYDPRLPPETTRPFDSDGENVDNGRNVGSDESDKDEHDSHKSNSDESDSDESDSDETDSSGSDSFH